MRPVDKSLAGLYDGLAKSYAAGMRPSAQGIDAYLALRTALSYDRQLGGNNATEILQKQASVANAAALAFINRKNFAEAVAAVKIAEGQGAGDTATTRKLISGGARDLYEAAVAEIDTNRNAAIAKLKQVILIVPATNIYHGKATKLLSANGG